MKLYRIDAPGSIDGLARHEAPEPVPGRGQILVRVRACSLNYRDLMVVRGQYASGTRPGLVPLSDGAGEVVAVGADVTRFAVGDRVCGCFFDNWIDGALTREGEASARGGAIDGMLAELVVLSETGAVATPAHLTDAEAATLPCAALTAWHALVDWGCAAPGETVLTQGTGGVSIFAVQFAALLGLRVIATTSSPAKAETLRALGAATVIDYRAEPEWQDAVRAATGRAGVDLAVEVGGPGTFARSMAATRVGGRIAVIGLLSGPGERIDPLTILRRRLAVAGLLVGSTAMFAAMNRAISTHALRPVVDRVFPFDEVPAAYRHLAEARHVGKVVVVLP